jgi:purine-binding chemotaxis protein CheW
VSGHSDEALVGPAPVAHVDANDEALLHERARLLARPEARDEDRRRNEGYIRFRLGAGEHYGVPYRHAEEIMHVGAISPVPCTPRFVRGVINRRGDMITVLDLKALFEVSGPDDPEHARILVVAAATLTVGLLVDEVVDNDDYEPDGLDRPVASRGLPTAEHLLGLHEGTVALLDLDALLGDRRVLGLGA